MEIKPNKIYLIIGSAEGPKGNSVGRKCRTIGPVTDRPPHTLWGTIWTVESVDGQPFTNTLGGSSVRVMVAEDWLQEEPPESPKEETRVVEKELTNE